ncbi:SDR family NAD(P)-dependent oxidoreductase [Lentiprolixibacter aurantiacus]|uniref:SDR family oxidoreductase n=1 Tax=Lentiprolixibacter aurantiacus TaxID=2993939 RepID=A0AAE3MKJ4_9FLAO|nr:SDR family oxidoreductase [Lentiprolixibacter aurantiacus]MCX2718747.1 SDR family oxidoreductase [Lentiprolixibacter aurantiacus]
MQKLKNKVVVITGGNSGIGLETVKAFLSQGAKVVFSGRRQEALDEVASSISGDFRAVLADQSRIEDNSRLIREAVAAYGQIDVLFVNAGVAYFAPADQIDEDHFTSQFNTNIKGPAFLVKEAISHMNEGSSIIFNTSIVHLKGFEAAAVYSATKGALRAYARVLTTELAPKGIRVNSIAPGPIATPIYNKMGMPEEAVNEMGKSFAASNPLGRFGEPREIAEVAVFLASEGASYINGIEIAVDGGMSQI